MTIEELLGCDITKLEKMSDEELREHFKPYMSVTQPEPKVAIVKPKRKKSVNKKQQQNLEEQMKALAELHGVELDKPAKDMLPANLR